MNMKYVVYAEGGLEHMIIFPGNINHNHMANALERLRFGGENWHRGEGEIVSAGFIDGGECHGRSESLNIDGRKAVDTLLYKAGGLGKIKT